MSNVLFKLNEKSAVELRNQLSAEGREEFLVEVLPEVPLLKIGVHARKGDGIVRLLDRRRRVGRRVDTILS